MEDDKGQLTKSALKWMYEMELLDTPAIQQNIWENVFFAHMGIKDCKIFMTPPYTNQKGLLIWVKIGIWNRLFHRKIIYTAIIDAMNNLLPSYQVRVVGDERILELAQLKLEETYGEKNEEIKKPTDSSNIDSGSSVVRSEVGGSELSEKSDILPDSEEQDESEGASKVVEPSVYDETE